MPMTEQQAGGLVDYCNKLLQEVEKYKKITEEQTKQVVDSFTKTMSSLFSKENDFYKNLVTAGRNIIVEKDESVQKISELYNKVHDLVDTCEKTLLDLSEKKRSELDGQASNLLIKYANFLETSGLKNKNISITINRKSVRLNDLFENYIRYLMYGEHDYDHLSVLSDKKIREDVANEILIKDI